MAVKRAGRVAAWVMAHRPFHRQRNSWVVSLLDVQPTGRVLEIGFGPGLAVAELSRRADGDAICGPAAAGACAVASSMFFPGRRGLPRPDRSRVEGLRPLADTPRP
jgi:hypothetical protein